MKTLLSSTVAVVALSFASADSFAQYGACEPVCETPTVEACAPAVAAPSCDVSCAPSTCETYGYAGCDGSLCNGLYAFVDDVARVAVAPLHWIAGAFTEGIYPDCGCAPRPPKTACNPCTICGDYVGGCNDGACANDCAPCEGYSNGTLPSYSSSNYGSPEFYDVESYDNSPTRYGAAAPVPNSSPIAQSLRVAFGVRRPAPTAKESPIVAGIESQPRAVRSVSYEQIPSKLGNIRQGQLSRAASPGTLNSKIQNDPNASDVRSNSTANTVPGAKTFGKTRAIK